MTKYVKEFIEQKIKKLESSPRKFFEDAYLDLDSDEQTELVDALLHTAKLNVQDDIDAALISCLRRELAYVYEMPMSDFLDQFHVGDHPVLGYDTYALSQFILDNVDKFSDIISIKLGTSDEEPIIIPEVDWE